MNDHNPVIRPRINVISQLGWLELICCGRILHVFGADEENHDHAAVPVTAVNALLIRHQAGELEGRPVPGHYPEELRA